jgi:hypothetical protein
MAVFGVIGFIPVALDLVVLVFAALVSVDLFSGCLMRRALFVDWIGYFRVLSALSPWRWASMLLLLASMPANKKHGANHAREF